jgi:hypothetical protein
LWDDPRFVTLIAVSQLISKMIEESSEDAALFRVREKHLGFQITIVLFYDQRIRLGRDFAGRDGFFVHLGTP